jgi:hypothetical protein
MEPKLAEAARRYGFVESKPVGGMEALLTRDLRSAMAGEETPECFCVEHGLHIERLKSENAALQDLMTKRDMEIDYLCNARPTVLRLDWYCIGLATLANIALHFAFV